MSSSAIASYSRLPARPIPVSSSTAGASRESPSPRRCTTARSHSHGAKWKKLPRSFSVLPVHETAGV